MPKLQPSVRGSVVLSQLEGLRALPASEQNRLLSNVPADLIAKLSKLGRLEWLPVETWMDLSAPIFRVVGKEAYENFWRQTQMQMIEQPLFKNIVSGGIRMFGLSPATFCKLVPTAQALVFSDAGKFSHVAKDEKHADIVWSDVPAEVLRHEPMAIGFKGAFTSFFALCNTTGTITVTEKAGSVVFALGWS